ncbi:CaiB/BaiF CoA transferase family protein [Haloglomus litoreum]|uniref:CaiB/BaiF CoA transferase family protein n=1 Tax=Haloglomus litoreum TaxID=3034026 RepID=UPI0023E7E5AC|nr:CaiB/BaiF CoA-transferase family protein [Haloglomus sp. DT116]
MSGPLDGVEVVELGTAIAGPMVGKLLGDNGANVVKVERLEGGPHRWSPLWYDPEDVEDLTYRFLQLNTSKDSIAIDLKSEAGAEILWQLVDEADVLVENMRPGVLERLGFGWEELSERNPQLIHTSITGFGEDGPYADWPAVNNSVAAVAGWLDRIGDGDRPSTMRNLFAIDHLTGVYGALGTCMALVERGTTGEGTQVEVTMLDAAISFLSNLVAEYSASLGEDGVEPRYEEVYAPNGVYEVADGYMALWAPARWENFCEAIDRPEFADPDHRFATTRGRVEHDEDLREALEEVFRERTATEWASYFDERVRGVVCAPVNSMAEVFEDPQVRHRESIVHRTHPEMGEYAVPRSPVTFPGRSSDVGHAPLLGGDTDTILTALGYPEERIAALHDAEVVR